MTDYNSNRKSDVSNEKHLTIEEAVAIAMKQAKGTVTDVELAMTMDVCITKLKLRMADTNTKLKSTPSQVKFSTSKKIMMID